MLVGLLSINYFDLILDNFLMTLLRHIMLIKRIFETETWTVFYSRKFGLFYFRVFLYILHVELFPLFKVRQLHLWTLFDRKILINLRDNLMFDFFFHNWRVFYTWRFSVEFQINDCTWKDCNYNNRDHTNDNNDCGIVGLFFLSIRVIVVKNRIGLLTLVSLELSSFIH